MFDLLTFLIFQLIKYSTYKNLILNAFSINFYFFYTIKIGKKKELFEIIRQLLYKTQQKITNQICILLYNVITALRFLTGLFLFECKLILIKNA